MIGSTQAKERRTEEVLRLASELVRIPSRAEDDTPDQIINFLNSWLSGQGVRPEIMEDISGRKLGIYVRIDAAQPGPALCLDACLDTAGIGDRATWSHDPFGGKVSNGRLYGRGAADSKIAVSIFANLAVELLVEQQLKKGSLYLLFDADEHTGSFGGAKAFLTALPHPPDAVIIGYPGNYGIVVGARGFLRARLTTAGIAEHSGTGHTTRSNAILKMAHLIRTLNARPLPEIPAEGFDLGPKLSITAVEGGQGFSQIPDLCHCNVDFRLTPGVDKAAATDWITEVVAEVDATHRSPAPTLIEFRESWPAYRLPAESPIVTILKAAAQEEFGRPFPEVVCGPSNIGNFLAAKGVPAICGFGVSYRNTHAKDEYIEVPSVGPIYASYKRAVTEFLS